MTLQDLFFYSGFLNEQLLKKEELFLNSFILETKNLPIPINLTPHLKCAHGP
jgi:hypothetical protein